ncbi:MAG: hypothetical protein PHY80_04950 [Rickettsiales bacterium]|nr:hypothetical protein [Rickettsiales bacterium]
MVNKINKKKQTNNIKEDIKVKNIKKPSVVFNILLYFILVIGIVFFIVLYLNFHVGNIETFNEKPQIIERIDDNGLRSELNTLKTKNQILEERIINNINETDILRSRVENYELKIGKIQIDTQRIDLIRLALNIQRCVELGENYNNILNSFKTLMVSNNDLESELTILSKYQNAFFSKQIIEDRFYEEMEEFVKQNNLLNNKGEFSNFMSKFVIVRKIKNTEENTADDFINQLEQSMKMGNYVEVFNIIKNSEEYTKYFSNTIRDIKINILINNAIQDIINYLVNN